ncbi:MAG: hypothetical protein H7123_02030, partial [Thermoleophilia bacterium]|nr:hypothetical protein [Thermoleophilia bacterium]
MRRRLQLSYLMLTIMLLAMLEVPLAISHARGERADLTSKLERDAVSIAAIGDEAVATGDPSARANLITIANKYTTQSGVRVVVVDTKGIAIVDSDVKTLVDATATNSTNDATATGSNVAVDAPGNGTNSSPSPAAPGSGRSFASRPEIRRALSGRVASGTRHSNTLKYELLYVAVPIASGGAVDGAVRVSYPSNEIDQRIA